MGTLLYLSIIFAQIGYAISSCCYEYSTSYCINCSGYCSGYHGSEYCYSTYYYYDYYDYSDISGSIGPFSVESFIGLIIGVLIFLGILICVIVAICSSCTKSAGTAGRIIHPTTSMHPGTTTMHSTTTASGFGVLNTNTNIYNTQPSAPPAYMFGNPAFSTEYGFRTQEQQPPRPVMPPSYSAFDQERPPPPPEYTSFNTAGNALLPPIQGRQY